MNTINSDKDNLTHTHDKKLKIWINACEVSGDLQAGILLSSLKKSYPMLEAIGMGGNKLEEEGQVNFFHINELSVMGIVEVLQSIPKIFKLLREIKKSILEHKPDAILLVDSAEFNFRIAKFAKKHNIPVYYFIPPKVWATREYRIKFLQKYVRSILCILPFEVEYYKKYNINVSYIQNPLVDFLAPFKKENREFVPFRIALMPGSRKSEINYLLPIFAKTAALLKHEFPKMEFHIIQAPNFSREYLTQAWEENCEEELHKDANEENDFYPLPKIQFVSGSERYKFLRTCEFCIAASGTATLETGLLGVPTVISYKGSKLSYYIVMLFLKVKFVGLVNLIFNREVFPEYLQNEAKADILARQIKEWLYKSDKIDKINKDLKILEEKMAAPSKRIDIFDDLL